MPIVCLPGGSLRDENETSMSFKYDELGLWQSLSADMTKSPPWNLPIACSFRIKGVSLHFISFGLVPPAASLILKVGEKEYIEMSCSHNYNIIMKKDEPMVVGKVLVALDGRHSIDINPLQFFQIYFSPLVGELKATCVISGLLRRPVA